MLCMVPPQMDASLDMEGPVQNAFHENDEQVGVVQRDFNTFHDARSDLGPNHDSKDLDINDDLHRAVNNLHLDRARLADRTSTPLFASARLMWLTYALLILSLCTTNGCLHLFITKLLTILANTTFAEFNLLPKTKYAASKFVKKLGLSYNAIHVCTNSYMLFKPTT